MIQGQKTTFVPPLNGEPLTVKVIVPHDCVVKLDSGHQMIYNHYFEKEQPCYIMSEAALSRPFKIGNDLYGIRSGTERVWGPFTDGNLMYQKVQFATDNNIPPPADATTTTTTTTMTSRVQWP